MSGQLARVAWKMGQTLLPEHFSAQEEALLANVMARFRALGLPAYGIVTLRWNDGLLSEGVLSITAATIVLPSGRLIDLPGNAVASPFTLSLPGQSHLSVYLHVLADSAAGAEPQDGWSSEQLSDVPRLVSRVVLAPQRNYPEAIETIKLAEFDKTPQGVWQLSDDYVPPLLQLGSSPFLQAQLQALPPSLEGFQYKLAMDAASYLSGGLASVRQCLKSVYKMQRYVGNIAGQVRPHPYHAYETLKDFYIDVCLYRGASPKDPVSPYNHDQLADCFRRVLEPLAEQMQQAEERSPYLPFDYEGGVYKLLLNDDAKRANLVYFLVQKNTVGRELALETVKLASPSRLPLVHKLALRGVPLKKVQRPMMAHSFGPEVEFFQVSLGEEWQYAVREDALAFYETPQLKELEFYLYWQVD